MMVAPVASRALSTTLVVDAGEVLALPEIGTKAKLATTGLRVRLATFPVPARMVVARIPNDSADPLPSAAAYVWTVHSSWPIGAVKTVVHVWAPLFVTHPAPPMVMMLMFGVPSTVPEDVVCVKTILFTAEVT